MKKNLFEFLKEPEWINTIKTGIAYSRQHDDTDGELTGILEVSFGPDGDAWVMIDGHKMLRFRNYFGGGRSLRTHAALMVLAEAIRQDNEGV